MGKDEDWIARYIKAGGTEDDAKNVLKRMQDAQRANSAQSQQLTVSASASKDSNSSMLTSKNGNAQLTPAERSSEPATTTAPESDLFGEIPKKTPVAAKSIAKSKPAAKKRGRKPASFDATERVKTQQELDLFHLSMEIEEKNAKETGDLGFLATAMIYASLPHSEIEGAVFKRRNGNISLTILTDPDIGLPYGKLPRIITAFLCTEAKRNQHTQGPEIHLGHSQAEFMAKLGLHNSGGPRGDIARAREQAKRLFTSTISLTAEKGSQFHWKNVNISDEGMLLWNPQDVNEKSPWQSKLILGSKFYSECVDHSIPIDLRVIHKMRSPLAIDIYVWLTYRFNSIAVPTPITWKQLQWQFAANYSDTKQGEVDFKTNFTKQLRNVLAIYPEAKLDVRQDKIVLLPSRPHILPDAS